MSKGGNMNLLKNPAKESSAEQACLGSCLIDKDAFMTTAETIVIKDFSSLQHQCIYETMLELLNEKVAVDSVTLTSRLQMNGNLPTAGHVTYLTELVNSVPTVKNIEHYISLIKHASRRRKQYELLTEVEQGNMEIENAITEFEKLGDNEVKEETFQSILEATMIDTMKGTEFTFGIEALNKHLGGLDKGELLTIGGYTSQAKSGLAIQMAINQAIKGRSVLFLSTEMLSAEIGRRILGNMGSVNIMDLRKGLLSAEEREELEFITREIGERWNINIKKIYGINDISKYVRKYNPELLFVDYVQNLSGETDYNTATRNIKMLQSITLQNELGTICVSQLNRNKEEIREPRLSDLRDTGRIEECSNIVLFLYWKDRLKQANKQRFGGEDPVEIEILISKNRDGSIGRTNVHFYPEYARIEDVLGKEYQQNMDYHDKGDK